MKNVLIIFLAFVFSCKTNSNNTESVPFKIAENYFVKNDQTANTPVEKIIRTQEAFDEMFEPAAYMGKNGMPTAIDFSKDQVIAIMLPVSNTSTEIIPVSIKINEIDEAEFYYKIKSGEKLGYFIKPSLLIIVSKEYEMIRFRKQN